MCHISCIVFGAKSLNRTEVEGKKVIELGSYDMNGSLRPILESWAPVEYVGIDIMEGSGVDMVCGAEEVLEKFGKESFDVVISTELLEHVKDWRKVISNIKNICKPDGTIIITTRSYGYHYHATPHDFWRYEIEDMKEIFSDYEILALEKDDMMPGLFAKLRKPLQYVEKDLSSYSLYSMVVGCRARNINDEDLKTFYFKKMVLMTRIKDFISNAIRFILSKF